MEDIPIRSPKGLHILVNSDTDPFFMYIDYDVRSEQLNMEFQHYHDFYEMFIMVDSSAGHLIEGQFYNLNKGDIVLINPGTLHKSVYYGKESTPRIVIRFRMEFLEKKIGGTRRVLSIFDPANPILRLPHHECDEVMGVLASIYTLRKNSPDYQDLEVVSLLVNYLCKIYHYRNLNCYTNETFDKVTQKIYSIAGYIHKHFSEDLKLEELADKFFISYCYLSRKFKEVSGFSLVQYIQMTRIRNAQKMLLNTDETIQNIAEKCGFTSFSQFNRVFEKYCTIPPSVFRKRGKEGKINVKKLEI